jgi:hypothetical protein
VDGKRNIFISHIHEDDGRLKPLRELLAQSGFDARDASINSSNPNNASSPEYIKYQILAPRIQWASVLVVLISHTTKESEYVNWEIEYAQQLGKRIVGVWDHGAAQCDVPEALDKYADAIVGWQGDRIKDAINGEIGHFESPDDAPLPQRAIPRYTC